MFEIRDNRLLIPLKEQEGPIFTRCHCWSQTKLRTNLNPIDGGMRGAIIYLTLQIFKYCFPVFDLRFFYAAGAGSASNGRRTLWKR